MRIASACWLVLGLLVAGGAVQAQDSFWKMGSVQYEVADGVASMTVGARSAAVWTRASVELLTGPESSWTWSESGGFESFSGGAILTCNAGIEVFVNGMKIRCVEAGKLFLRVDKEVQAGVLSGRFETDGAHLERSEALALEATLLSSLRTLIASKTTVAVDVDKMREELRLEMESFEEAGVVSVEGGAACLDSSGGDSAGVQNENVNTQIDPTQAGLRIHIVIPSPKR